MSSNEETYLDFILSRSGEVERVTIERLQATPEFLKECIFRGIEVSVEEGFPDFFRLSPYPDNKGSANKSAALYDCISSGYVGLQQILKYCPLGSGCGFGIGRGEGEYTSTDENGSGFGLTVLGFIHYHTFLSRCTYG